MVNKRNQIRHIFRNVAKRCYDTAESRLYAQLPAIMSIAHEYAIEEQRKAEFGSMTGNWINSFGVALYREGRCVGVANMSGDEKSPIRMTLIAGGRFPKGEQRFDEEIQSRGFWTRHGSSGEYFADQEVLRWLGRSRSKSKGFSFRVVSVIEYHKQESRNVLLRLSDEFERRGGNIWQFNLG